EGGREVESFEPEYWVRHMLEPVQFAAAIETLARRGVSAYVEIGPGATLTNLVGQCLGETGAAYLPSLRGKESPWPRLMTGLGALHAQGVEIDWERLAPGSSLRVVRPSGEAI